MQLNETKQSLYLFYLIKKLYNHKMQKLPIEDVLQDIITTFKTANRLVLQAPPGAGKTSLVPLALSKAFDQKIIMLEPRRLAARSSALRMAELLNTKIGDDVGYIVKGESKVSKNTKIVVVTEGILTRMLQNDASLEGYGIVIFDEFHERSLHADLSLALTLESQELLRDDLKILVMSATLNSNALTSMLDAKLIKSLGRSFEVEEIFLSSKTLQPTLKELPKYINKLILKIIKSDNSSILVFLPGAKEIKSLEKLLKESIKDNKINILPLYGALDKKEQQRVIEPSADGERKIVIATNIAQTSLTIDGIGVVIDSGLQKISLFNSNSMMSSLHTQFISQDDATQRAGRAGRLFSGKVYKLWHKHKTLVKHPQAQILRDDLSSFTLELASWGVNETKELKFLDYPPKNLIDSSKKLLKELELLDTKNLITTHGKKVLELGVHPRLAHMVLNSSKLGLTHQASLLATILSEKDVFNGSSRYDSDIGLRVEYLHNNLNSHKEHQKTYNEFRKKLPTFTKTLDISLTGVLLAFAYPDRIAKLRDKNKAKYLLASGKGAVLNFEDSLYNEEFLVIGSLDALDKDAKIHLSSPISSDQIYRYFSYLIKEEKELKFNLETQKVEAKVLKKLGSIILDEKKVHNLDEEDIHTTLLDYIQTQSIEIFNFSKECKNLIDRVNFYNYHIKDSSFPNFNYEYLLKNLQWWLKPHLIGVKSIKAIQKLDFKTILLSLLTWEQQELLNKELPQKLKVPSGSNISINYSNPLSPTLSVKLQELFGLYETPKVLNNTIPLSIDLLSPALRSMQITKDLKSFWDNTYDEVRKELNSKYKKHYWPLDPKEAIATSKTKKNM